MDARTLPPYTRLKGVGLYRIRFYTQETFWYLRINVQGGSLNVDSQTITFWKNGQGIQTMNKGMWKSMCHHLIAIDHLEIR